MARSQSIASKSNTSGTVDGVGSLRLKEAPQRHPHLQANYTVRFTANLMDDESIDTVRTAANSLRISGRIVSIHTQGEPSATTITIVIHARGRVKDRSTVATDFVRDLIEYWTKLVSTERPDTPATRSDNQPARRTGNPASRGRR